MLTQNSAVSALTADHLFLCESSSAHLLSQMMSRYPEPTKVWVPISSSLFFSPRGVKKYAHKLLEGKRQRDYQAVLMDDS